MIAPLRQRFNGQFTEAKYQRFLALLDQRCGTPIPFRNCETPLFLPRELFEQMALAGQQLVAQLLGNAEYLHAANAAIPPGSRTAGDIGQPLFVQADFGLVRLADGTLAPRLVEIQGFPSLYAYQPVLAGCYRDAYGLDAGLRALPANITEQTYDESLRRAITGDHDPENVVLLEIDPWNQKTLADFLETERRYGVKTIDVREVKQQGQALLYSRAGRDVPIHRIYNRAIADELIRKQIELPFSLHDDLQVEWAGHPNWFFLISKFSLPWLRHPTVPKSWFLDRLETLPDDLHNYVLKPLYSFAGRGVIVEPVPADIDAIPAAERGQYILQEKLDFMPTIDTPHGPTKCEVRVMYVGGPDLTPVNTIVRMGRGSMMGVDQNRDLQWVGASAAFLQ